MKITETIVHKDVRGIVYGASDNITHGSVVSKLLLNRPQSETGKIGWNELIELRKKETRPLDWNDSLLAEQRERITFFKKNINCSGYFNWELADLLNTLPSRLEELVEENNQFIQTNAENLIYLIVKSGINRFKIAREIETEGKRSQKSLEIPVVGNRKYPQAYLLAQFALSVVANSVLDAQYACPLPQRKKAPWGQKIKV